jgi:hypothetical protein
MNDTPTPGQLCYVAYVTALRPSMALYAAARYANLSQDEHRAWDAAAHAAMTAWIAASLAHICP